MPELSVMVRLSLGSLLFCGLTGCTTEPSPPVQPPAEADERLLLEPSALLEWPSSKPDLLVVDARPPEAYQTGHIPGALNIPVDSTWNEDFKMLSINEIERLFGESGISERDRLVLYDGGDHKSSARLFWVLESHGHSQVQVLHGGLPGWQAAGGSLTSEPTQGTSKTYRSAMQPARMASKLDTFQAIDNPNIILMDVRPTDEYEGKTSPIGRLGRIPSSLNLPWSTVLEEDNGVQRIRPHAELQADLTALNLTSQPIVAYCNKGKQSAVVYLALRDMGHAVAAYDGSWWEWSADDNMPRE